MPAKKIRTTKKLQPKRQLKSFNFFMVLAVLLGMIAGVLMVKVFYRGEPKATEQSTVTLGVLEYDFSSGKAVKRTTPLVTSLRAFLNDAAAKDCKAVHDFMDPTQFTVHAATKDMKQVLLGYGCGDLSSRMFAVYEDDAWKFLSPTNQFDMITQTPLCSHVKEYGIKKEIAPVCYKIVDDAAVYHVR